MSIDVVTADTRCKEIEDARSVRKERERAVGGGAVANQRAAFSLGMSRRIYRL